MYQWSINIGPSTQARVPEPVVIRGLFMGTLVAAQGGWVPVEKLVPGARVWTFDSGLQVIQDIRTRDLPAREGGEDSGISLMHVPAGALANTRDLLLLPEQGLLLECENASDAYGDPFAVVPIAALEEVFGITRRTARKGQRLYELVFADEQALYIDSGLIAHLPSRPGTGTATRYDVRSVEDAQKMLTDLDIAELALREPDEEFFGEMAPDRVA